MLADGDDPVNGLRRPFPQLPQNPGDPNSDSDPNEAVRAQEEQLRKEMQRMQERMRRMMEEDDADMGGLFSWFGSRYGSLFGEEEAGGPGLAPRGGTRGGLAGPGGMLGGMGFGAGGRLTGGIQMTTREDDKAVFYEIQVKDLAKEKVNIRVENETVTISGNIESTGSSDEEGATRMYFKSSFQRTFPVPEGTDASKARMRQEKDKIIVEFPKTS